jgi:hypothetical protein
MEFNWLIEGFKFYFLKTAIGVVGAVTLYVFAKMYQESRG